MHDATHTCTSYCVSVGPTKQNIESCVANRLQYQSIKRLHNNTRRTIRAASSHRRQRLHTHIQVGCRAVSAVHTMITGIPVHAVISTLRPAIILQPCNCHICGVCTMPGSATCNIYVYISVAGTVKWLSLQYMLSVQVLLLLHGQQWPSAFTAFAGQQHLCVFLCICVGHCFANVQLIAGHGASICLCNALVIRY